MRPYLIEVQALVSNAAYGTPQRTATGYDNKRMNMLLAVLEKRVGMKMFSKDVFLNFAGGFKVADPGLDLAVTAAVISSYYDRPVGEGVCCGDLAGDEAAWPMKNFVYLFEEAKQLGLPFVIHAGECGSAENIREAVECGARRIGHGIAMKGHPDIIKLVKDTRTGVEMCPISNLQTKAVEGPEDYPMREFLDNGLLVTVNTDNRTVSNTSISRELGFIQETYGIRDDELKLMMENAVRVSFAGDSVKDRILKEIRAFG